ncbi:hypothetical protein OOU_Y34scaffold00528g31 [Pyricularia oryzae Y34]|uniref:Uncharacterized protein n=2 Tax=Pyricularia oryzae TaxID=318829 RepID=A0AA97NYJ6_PYRO3|nr:hypothetical protein OOU_Y34scaffold00528g31 [Pyricularia oryzae Y34]
MCAVLEPPGPSTGKLSKVGRTLDSHSIFTVAKQNQNDAGNDDISTLVALLSEAPASPVLSLYLKLSSGMTPTSRLSWNPPSPPIFTIFTTRQWRLTGVLSSKMPSGTGIGIVPTSPMSESESSEA